MPKPAPKKYHAFAGHAVIEAVIHELFRFKTKTQAESMAERIGEEFILAGKLIKGEPKGAVALWVRGYASAPEKKKGYTGNYARLEVKKLEGGRWTLAFSKIDLPPRQHPERRVVDRRHPNWGHAVMRDINKGRVYATMQEAQAQLTKLHEEFPEVTIPGLGKLRAMVYRKPENGAAAIQRLELAIRKRGENEYIIEHKEAGAGAREAAPKRVRQREHELPREQQGHFTIMVERRRRRKTA